MVFIDRCPLKDTKPFWLLGVGWGANVCLYFIHTCIENLFYFFFCYMIEIELKRMLCNTNDFIAMLRNSCYIQMYFIFRKKCRPCLKKVNTHGLVNHVLMLCQNSWGLQMITKCLIWWKERAREGDSYIFHTIVKHTMHMSICTYIGSYKPIIDMRWEGKRISKLISNK